ncbi:MAG: Stp1/IreP family PP2C-type Ser/Thr phosphatase [Nitrospirota bacterium]
MKISVYGKTDIGRIRNLNEDSYGIYPEINLYIVADGMGGHIAGDVASSIAVDSISEFVLSKMADNKNNPDTIDNILIEATKSANIRIIDRGRRKSHLRGMGTTVVSVLITDNVAYISHVGDSRAYIIRRGEIEQLTYDHSLVMEYVSKNIITEEEAESHPYKHILSRALGTDLELDIDIRDFTILPQDIFLLCSDGLSNMINRDEMLAVIINNNESPEDACTELIDLANDHGGRDNITAIVVKCMEENE